MIVKPLYGHTTPETAYVVENYPYGSHRTQVRYWLEYKPKHGFRFISQSRNPMTGRWNNPHKSTYMGTAAAMYLDEKSHVQWAGLHITSGVEAVSAFVRDFPEAVTDTLRTAVGVAVRFRTENRDWLNNGRRYDCSLGVEPVQASKKDIDANETELAAWVTLQAIIG